MDGIVMSDVNSNVKTAPCFGTEWDGNHPDCQRCFSTVFGVCKVKTLKHKEDKERESQSECKSQPIDLVIESLRKKFNYTIKETKKARVHYFQKGKNTFIIAVSVDSGKVRFQTSKKKKDLARLESVKQAEDILRELAIENK